MNVYLVWGLYVYYRCVSYSILNVDLEVGCILTLFYKVLCQLLFTIYLHYIEHPLQTTPQCPEVQVTHNGLVAEHRRSSRKAHSFHTGDLLLRF